MTSMRPAHPHIADTEIETETLDDVIERIDVCLPEIHRKAAECDGKPGTDRLKLKEFKKAQEVFQDMKDDPLLTDDGADIRLVSKRKKKAK